MEASTSTENQGLESARAPPGHEELELAVAPNEIQVGLVEAQLCWAVKPLQRWATGQDGDGAHASFLGASTHIFRWLKLAGG